MTSSKEHEGIVRFICKKLNLEPIIIKGNHTIKGKYFPDAINKTTDYEVEVVPRKNYLERKEEKWDKTRKKILILKTNSYAIKKFDEIFIYIKNKLIKIK